MVIMIVIDTLNKYNNNSNIRGIMGVLPHTRPSDVNRLRVMITSQPETPIHLGFEKVPEILHHRLLLHDQLREVVDSDICLFLYHELSDMCTKHGLRDDWPSIDMVNRLVQLAAGLFIFTATVCRFIQEKERRQSAHSALTMLPKTHGASSTVLDPKYCSDREHNKVTLDRGT